MRTFTHRYGSDITRDQFNLIRADLEGARKHTAPRQIDLYDVFCAMLYTMKNGCTWRDLPSDFPKWQTVYYYWALWTKQENPIEMALLTRVLKKLSLSYDLAKAGQPELRS